MQPFSKILWLFFRNPIIVLSNDAAILMLRVYPNQIKSTYEKVTCTHLFIAAQFTLAKV